MVGVHLAIINFFEDIKSEGLNFKPNSIRQLEQATQTYLARNYQRLSLHHFRVQADADYYESRLVLADMQNCKKVSTPSVARPSNSTEPIPLGPIPHHVFRATVGKIRYILDIRPDLLQAGRELSKALASPTDKDWEALCRILRYIQGTKHCWLNLQYWPNKTLEQFTYSDTDWAADIVSRRSGACILSFVNGVLLHGQSTMLKTVSTSSGEAEFGGMTTAASISIGISELLKELNDPCTITVCADSSTALSICNREGPGKVRHLAVKTLWIQELVRARILKVAKVPTANNLADIGTKALGSARLRFLATAIGMS